MTSPAPVLLILGGGANVGAGVARAFAAKGYKVASTSRTQREHGKDGVDLHIQSDLSDSNNVAGIFKKVSQDLGPPSVVVYNAVAHTPNPADDPLSLDVKDLNQDLLVNTSSVLAAAREARAVFANLPATASRTFIYTGNTLNVVPIAPFLSLGIGKSGAAYLIASASEAYASKGYRFYYADERNADGSAVYDKINAKSHGDFYTQLAEGKSPAPWLATFVGGKGYVDFSK